MLRLFFGLLRRKHGDPLHRRSLRIIYDGDMLVRDKATPSLIPGLQVSSANQDVGHCVVSALIDKDESLKSLTILAHEVRRRLRVRRNLKRHDGQVSDAQVLRAVHPQLWIHDAVLLAREHAEGAARVVARLACVSDIFCATRSTMRGRSNGLLTKGTDDSPLISSSVCTEGPGSASRTVPDLKGSVAARRLANLKFST